MKKSILTLLFLLLLLIMTCVYQKTYTLYAQTTEDHTTIVPMKQNALISPKKEAIVVKHTEDIPTKKLVEEKQPLQEPSFLDTVTKSITTVITPKKQETKDRIVTPATIKSEAITIPIIVEKDTSSTQKEEKEVVDYLLSVLKEQDDALVARDEAEEKLHTLIKHVLQNRQIAIENMEKASLDIDKGQKERLEKRDAISQNNTEEKGK